MKRILAVTMMTGLLVSAAGPATAEAPDRFKQSGSFEYLFSASNECLPDAGVQTCTYIALQAADSPDGQDFVYLSVDRYELDAAGDYIRNLSYEFGMTDQGELTVTRKLAAKLAPTTLQLAGCDASGACDSRQVVVSASDTAVGDISTVRSSSTFRDGDCTYTNRESRTFAEVSGTITLDGVAYAESGFAETGDVRATRTCR